MYRFDSFHLDPNRGVVLGPLGEEIRLRPKAFKLLRHLLDNPGRLLPRETLLEALWPDVIVADDSLTQCISDLRHAFGDRAPRILRTVPKRGYVLTAEVQQEDATAAAPIAALPAAGPARTLQDLLAIHRLVALTPDAACALLAEGLAADLLAEFAHFEGVRAVAATGDEPEANYRIRGELRTVGEDIRITVRLEDSAGAALWADRLSHPVDDGPELAPDALRTLAAHLNQQIQHHTLSNARKRPLNALSARELCLIGRDHHHRSTEEETQLAHAIFARAIAIAPDYAPSYSWQAFTVQRAFTHGWRLPVQGDPRAESLRLALRAVDLAPDSALGLARLAFALLLHQRWDDALEHARAALASDRVAFTAARNTCADVLMACGLPEEAVVLTRRTIALDPFAPPLTHVLLGRALLLSGHPAEALPPLRLCATRAPDYTPSYDAIVVAAVEIGQMDEALRARAELLRRLPNWAPQNNAGYWYFRRDHDAERFLTAHRRAAAAAAGG